MVLSVYYVSASPPARAVLLTLKALAVKYELKDFNPAAGDHLSEEYLKKNPQHTFPMIEDDGFVLTDSHAINSYLVDKYKHGSSLYPTKLEDRAIVNQRMYFECSVLFAQLRRINLLTRGGLSKISDDDYAKVTEGYGFVEKFLEKGSKYVASDNVTLADFSMVTTLTTLNLYVPEINSGKYPALASYLERCKTFDGYEEINEAGLKMFVAVFSKFNYKFP